MKIWTTLLLLGITFSIHAQWTSSDLSIARSGTTTTVIGDKLVFASGNASGDDYQIAKKRVDIYDVSEDSWTEINLNIIRQYTFVEAINDRLYFAGYTQTFENDQDEVEIYDLGTGEWSSIEFPFNYGATSLTTMDNLLIGVKSSGVDIFNTTTEEWTSHTLSENRILPKAQGCNGKIYFAGGGSYVQGTSNTIDIYDVEENTWSVDTLVDKKNEIGSFCFDKEVYFVGGGTDFSETSPLIEKINTENGTKEVIEIEGLKINKEIAVTDEYLYFGIEEIENEYSLIKRMELTSYEMDSIYIPTPRYGEGILAHENKVYFAGGIISFDRTSLIEIFSELPSNLQKLAPTASFTIFPNPAHSVLNIQNLNGPKKYEIYNYLGQLAEEGVTNKSISINMLSNGTYYLKMEGQVKSFVKL